MLDKESSTRLDLIRFPFVMSVIFAHAYESVVGYADGTIGISQNSFVPEFIRNFIAFGIARASTPVFFLMSGYLLFLGFTWNREHYLQKLKSRTRSLLVPFLFWNGVTLLFFAGAQAFPLGQLYVSGQNSPIASYSFMELVSAFFGIGRFPIAIQFWFIRDLFSLVLLVPLINFLNTRVPGPFLISLSLCWFLGIWPFPLPGAEAALFFSLGGFLATRNISLFELDRYGKIIVLAYLVAAAFDASPTQEIDRPVAHRFVVTLGMLTALYCTKLAFNSPKVRKTLLSLNSASFFVFAAHYPLLTIVRKLAYRVIQPNSSYVVLALYILIPSLVILFLIGAFHLLRRALPRFTRVITGDRIRS